VETFDLIQDSLYYIRQLILSNDKIRKLLVNDSKKALTESSIDISNAISYIFLSPVFNVNKEPYNKNTFLTITLTDTTLDDSNNNHNSKIRINCLTRTELWEMENNRIRPLHLSSLIIKTLHGQKVGVSHKLYYDGTELTVLNENIHGYAIEFIMIDGGGLENEF
jgi:hypothetical protein